MSSTPNWLDLPADLTASILRRLEAAEILEAVQWVCMTWHRVCKDPSMWQSIEFGGFEIGKPSRMGKMCKNAVDWSCGQLKDIRIHYFANDQLLLYIADQAPQLRSLRLVSCNLVSGNGLTEVAKRLPNLEELHMYLFEVPKETLISFGDSCSQLKSLTYNIHGSLAYLTGEYDENAQAIAQTMTGLRHLSLIGNQMTNNGLQAILNRCLCLESLDLRKCFNVNLEAVIGSTCAQRITNLKFPNDSTDDYEFDATVYARWYESEIDYNYNLFSTDDYSDAFYDDDYNSFCDDDYNLFHDDEYQIFLDLGLSSNDYFGPSADE